MAIPITFNGSVIVKPGVYGSPKQTSVVLSDKKLGVKVARNPGETEEQQLARFHEERARVALINALAEENDG